MQRVIGDYLQLNRATPVRVYENNGTLYLDHAEDKTAPVIGYSENTLLDFAGAYYPKNLLAFAEKHGTLFYIDKYNFGFLADCEKEGDIPFMSGECYAPTEDALRDLFGQLGYPEGKGRQVSQDFKYIQRESVNRSSGFSYLLNQTEFLGDWVAARAMVQNVLELLGGASRYGRKGACPDFAVNLANAPRYRRFLKESAELLEKQTNASPAWLLLSKDENGNVTEEKFGLFFEGDVFRCHMPMKTTEEAISSLVTLHLAYGISTTCESFELHESFLNLLQVIWYQIPEQIGTRLDIAWCENPRCGNVMLKLRKVEKHACCTSCQQALKERR